jgi:hypothetical protein
LSGFREELCEVLPLVPAQREDVGKGGSSGQISIPLDVKRMAMSAGVGWHGPPHGSGCSLPEPGRVVVTHDLAPCYLQAQHFITNY